MATIVEQKQISGVWKFNDVLNIPSGDDSIGGYSGVFQRVNFTVSVNNTQLGIDCVASCDYMSFVNPGDGDSYFNAISSVPDLSSYGLNYPALLWCYVDSERGWYTDNYGEDIQTIDFGSEPQMVSAEFYEWMTENASQPTASIRYNGYAITNLFAGQKKTTLKCAGKTMEADVVVEVAESGGTTGGDGGTTDEGWIGDGNTHIWIELHEGRTSPMLGVCPNGTVTVDWGDGTTPDVLTGTHTSIVRWTPTHNYAQPGKYVITLTADGEIGFAGSSSYKEGPYILRHSKGADARNFVYQNAIHRIEIGKNGTSIGSIAFQGCRYLRGVVIHGEVTSIGNYAFYYTAITSAVIPESATYIGDHAFQSCKSLHEAVIPGGVTRIGNTIFSECSGLCYCDFTAFASVPTLVSTNAFTDISPDCEIRVPAALYDEWIAATNWATYASYIKAV